MHYQFAHLVFIHTFPSLSVIMLYPLLNTCLLYIDTNTDRCSRQFKEIIRTLKIFFKHNKCMKLMIMGEEKMVMAWLHLEKTERHHNNTGLDVEHSGQ